MNLETPQNKSRAMWSGVAILLVIVLGLGISYATHQSLVTLLIGLVIGVIGGVLW